MPSIASLPLAPAMALVTLLPPDGALQIRPAGDGLLCLEAVGRVMAAAVELEGESSRPVAIPAAALPKLRREIKAPHWLTVVEQPPGLLLRVQSLDQSAAITCSEPPELPPLCLDDAAAAPPAAAPPLLDLELLRVAVEVLQAAGCRVAALIAPEHPRIGLLLRADQAEPTAAAVAVARMVRPT
jgi:hypothetical protein